MHFSRIQLVAIGAAILLPSALAQTSKCPAGQHEHKDDNGNVWCIDSEGRSFAVPSATAQSTKCPQGQREHTDDGGKLWCIDSSGRSVEADVPVAPAANGASGKNHKADDIGTSKTKLLERSPSGNVNGRAGTSKRELGAPTITILDATYGQECGAPLDNDGARLKEACSGRQQCNYTFMPELVGGPSMSCIRTYVTHMTCGQEGKQREFVTFPSVKHTIISMACGASQDDEPVFRAKSDSVDTWPPLTQVVLNPLEEFMYEFTLAPIPLTSRPEDLPSSFDFACESLTQMPITAEQAVKKGNVADSTGDYKSAACWYMNASMERNSDADFRLGMYFMQGRGLSEDYWTGIKFLRSAADQGNVSAAAHLAEALDEGKNGVQYLRVAGYWNRRLMRSPAGREAYKEILAIRPEVRFPTRDLSKCNPFKPEDLMVVQNAADLSLYGWLEFTCRW
jgi:hypothetical protein